MFVPHSPSLPQAPLYAQKARLFPGSVFVIGYDTAIRLLDPKYYGSREDMLLQVRRGGTGGARSSGVVTTPS